MPDLPDPDEPPNFRQMSPGARAVGIGILVILGVAVIGCFLLYAACGGH